VTISTRAWTLIGMGLGFYFVVSWMVSGTNFFGVPGTLMVAGLFMGLLPRPYNIYLYIVTLIFSLFEAFINIEVMMTFFRAVVPALLNVPQLIPPPVVVGGDGAVSGGNPIIGLIQTIGGYLILSLPFIYIYKHRKIILKYKKALLIVLGYPLLIMVTPMFIIIFFFVLPNHVFISDSAGMLELSIYWMAVVSEVGACVLGAPCAYYFFKYVGLYDRYHRLFS